MSSLKKRVLIGAASVIVGIQVIPGWRNHTNPPVTQEPDWNSDQTRELAKRACYDCHSNETVWPWYSNVAPVSWFVQSDVDGGRRHLNFSEFDRPQRHADDAAKIVRDQQMPPSSYVLRNPQAKLSDAERQELADGLAASLEQEMPKEGTTMQEHERPGEEEPEH